SGRTGIGFIRRSISVYRGPHSAGKAGGVWGSCAQRPHGAICWAAWKSSLYDGHVPTLRSPLARWAGRLEAPAVAVRASQSKIELHDQDRVDTVSAGATGWHARASRGRTGTLARFRGLDGRLPRELLHCGTTRSRAIHCRRSDECPAVLKFERWQKGPTD